MSRPLTDFTVGCLLLARRSDVAAVTVAGLFEAAVSSADTSAACSLSASCGHDADNGMPVVPNAYVPLRLGVHMGAPYVITGCFALFATIPWAVAAAVPRFRPGAAAALMQAATFGTWAPMLVPLGRRSLAPDAVVQAMNSLGVSYTADSPAAAAAATGLGSAAFALGAVAVAAPFIPRITADHAAMRAVQAVLASAGVVAALILESLLDSPVVQHHSAPGDINPASFSLNLTGVVSKLNYGFRVTTTVVVLMTDLPLTSGGRLASIFAMVS